MTKVCAFFGHRNVPENLEPRPNIWMAAQCDLAITCIEHSYSRIHEPFDWLAGKKPVFNLGSY